MPLRIAVLVKQVPDTKNITGAAMKDDGTVNRSALPAIFNPEDLNALEMALQLRARVGGQITALCMGPPSAAEQMREALMRGADRVALLTDRAFAVADTLATAYALSCAIRAFGPFDLILAGRQAIDGDTAQVGPQLAGALGVPQLTYVREVQQLTPERIRVLRLIEDGHEICDAPFPCLLTVVDEANEPRPRRAKLMMRYRKARTALEVRDQVARRLDPEKGKPDPQLLDRESAQPIARLRDAGLLIPHYTPADLGADLSRCGKPGSPTQVKAIHSVVLTATEHKAVEPTSHAIAGLMHELIEDHVLD